MTKLETAIAAMRDIDNQADLNELANVWKLQMNYIGAKINLKTGDALKIKSDTASSADVWVSFIDSIST